MRLSEALTSINMALPFGEPHDLSRSLFETMRQFFVPGSWVFRKLRAGIARPSRKCRVGWKSQALIFGNSRIVGLIVYLLSNLSVSHSVDLRLSDIYYSVYWSVSEFINLSVKRSEKRSVELSFYHFRMIFSTIKRSSHFFHGISRYL